MYFVACVFDLQMVMATMERQRYMLKFRAANRAKPAKIDTGLRLVGRPAQHRIIQDTEIRRFEATWRW